MSGVHDSEPVNPYASPQPAEAVEQRGAEPVSFLEIAATGLRLYRNNLPTIFLVTMTVWVPLEFAQSYFEYFVLEPDDIGTAFQMRSLVEGLLGIIGQASVIAIGLQDLQGSRATWGSALRQGIAAWPRVLWSGILSQLAVVIGLIFLVIPGVYLAVKMSLYQCVAVSEGLNGPTCLNRSMKLAKGSFLGLLILGIVTIVAFLLISLIVQLPFIIIPAIDNWITYAISNLLVDLVAPMLTLTYVAAYWVKARGEDGDVPD
jgi:hypothetical protein